MSEVSSGKPMREEQRPARSEVEEVAPGILRIQLPISFPGLGHVNCYAMEDSNGVVLVDPGLPGPKTWRHLKRQLAAAGLPIKRVHTVVVTHSHPDHFGQAGRFRRAGAEIITHRSFRTFLDPEAESDDEALTTTIDAPSPSISAGHSCTHTGSAAAGAGVETYQLEEADDSTDGPGEAESPKGASQARMPFSGTTPWGGKPYDMPLARKIKYRLLRHAAGRFIATPKPTKRVADAQVLEFGGTEWVSVHTPGHTEDHLCLWDPAGGVMITGDHVLPTITPHISGLSESTDPLAQFFDSLDRMQTFDGVTTVLPAHGLVFEDLGGRADAIAQHHRERLDELRKAGETVGNGTVEDYMKQLFRPRSWGPMAESETYAHLQHLLLRNQAATDNDGPQLRYSIVD